MATDAPATDGPDGRFAAPSIAELGAAVVSELRDGWNGEDPAPVALGALPFAPGEVVLAVPSRWCVEPTKGRRG